MFFFLCFMNPSGQFAPLWPGVVILFPFLYSIFQTALSDLRNNYLSTSNVHYISIRTYPLKQLSNSKNIDVLMYDVLRKVRVN